jgi:oxygen-dependent protoporphyrinogen oxidase
VYDRDEAGSPARAPQSVVSATIPALVVGGGISGLVCAYGLRKRGIEAQVFEAAERPGGVIRSERRDGFLLEFGPQSFTGTSTLRSLCFDLGIGGELLEARRRAPRYILVAGTLQRVPLNPFSLFASRLLSASTKWTIACEPFGKTQPPHGDESVADFVRRKFTPELLDRLIGPFVSGIYAGDPERLSIRSAFPRLYEAERAAGSIVRGMFRRTQPSNRDSERRGSLLSFRDGNETLVRALAAKLGDALSCGTEVRALRLRPGGGSQSFEATVRRGSREQKVTADQLILATPTNVTARLLASTIPEIAPVLSGIEYAPMAVISLGYRRGDVGHPVGGFGFLVPRSEGLRALGTVWNSSLFPRRTPRGYILLTSFVGGATDPGAITLSQENLVAQVHREIAPVLKIQEKPVMSSVRTYARALPQYNLGHADRLAAIAKLISPFPKLHLIGNYFRGPSIGACVEQALEV